MFRSIVLIFFCLCDTINASYPRAKFYNWKPLDSHLIECKSIKCSITPFGEVTLKQIAECLNTVHKKCRFTVDTIYSHQARYNHLGNSLCVNPDENIIGLHIPDFYLPSYTLHWTESFQGHFIVQFAGLIPPPNDTCNLNSLNAYVKLENGCGWHNGWRNKLQSKYKKLASFKTGDHQHYSLDGLEFLDFLRELRGPGLFFIWEPEECFSPLTAYEFEIKATLLVNVGLPIGAHNLLKSSLIFVLGSFLAIATSN